MAPKPLTFKEVLPIDLSKLEVEWALQPEIYGHFAQQARKAELEYERALLRLEKFKAQKAMQIRMNPEQFGLSKVTESAVDDLIKLSPEYEELFNEVLDLKHRAKLFGVILKALEQRKDALANLVKLLSMEYFSADLPPDVEQDLRQKLYQVRSKLEMSAADDKVKKRIQKRRKTNATNQDRSSE